MHAVTHQYTRLTITLDELARFSKMSQLAFSSPHVIVKQFQQSLQLIAVLVLK